MNCRTSRIASIGIALVFLFAGISQARGMISSCSMPCCTEKPGGCHAPKEPTPKADHCCGDETTSSSLGSGCTPERGEGTDLPSVSHGPKSLMEGVEISVIEVLPTPSQGYISSMHATGPDRKAPLYLHHLILLI